MKSVKILYVGANVLKPQNGADVVNNRNIKILKEIYGDGLYIYSLKRTSKISTFLNILIGNVGFVKQSDYKKIISFIKTNKIDTLFLWSSKLGILASRVKKIFPNLRIIVFFHNIESQYYQEERKENNSVKNKLIASVIKKNEYLATIYADTLITLNKRDSTLLYELYGKRASFELPTSFRDNYNEALSSKYNCKQDNITNLLFVGFNFFGNTQGLTWFINTVLPSLSNVHLTIVGKDMDKAFKGCDNITVHGFVDDLAQYYYSTDIVVIPILSGGGMKTKTAEALMYGCAIVGTPEAFEGYDLDYSRIGALADNDIDMIKAIKRLSQNKDHIALAKQYARDIFLEKYSESSSIMTLKKNLHE